MCKKFNERNLYTKRLRIKERDKQSEYVANCCIYFECIHFSSNRIRLLISRAVISSVLGTILVQDRL